jgi:hypothetical protein
MPLSFTPLLRLKLLHACDTNGIPLGCSLLLSVGTVNSVQTLKDPNQSQIYGWAAWRGIPTVAAAANGADGGADDGNGIQAIAVLTLRNPSQHAQIIELNAEILFELPPFAPTVYNMVAPYPVQRVRELVLVAGTPISLALAPFEVLSFEAVALAPFEVLSFEAVAFTVG